MQLRKLLNGLRAAYKGSNIARRVQSFNGWTDRASAENAGTASYDHTQTVKEYYDLCGEFMVFG